MAARARRRLASLAPAAATCALIIGIAGCGGGSHAPSASTTSSISTAPATITLLEAKAPDSLDPQLAAGTQAAEADWLAYTGLLTYAHGDGVAGTQLIPGLASSVPTISDGGRTYTFALQDGLVYSDGEPVKASDFAWTVERAIRMRWFGARSYLEADISGASAFAAGRAKRISGIQTEDSSGQITIHLKAADGAFENVLAFPALGLVPSGTPLRDLSGDPPPGVGPYMLSAVVPKRSYALVMNPRWTSMSLPGIPSGHVDVDVKVSPNPTANVLSLLDDKADVLDWADPIPANLVAQVTSSASRRYTRREMNATYYVFLNTAIKPFSSQLAREAVVTGLDRSTMSNLAAGALLPGCFFLPPAVVGSPHTRCPYGAAAGAGNLIRAQHLISQSGMAGTKVTVWSEPGTPRLQWMTDYTSFLNQIGLDATQRVIPASKYYSTIGDLGANAQTGFDYWNADYPNPSDFYLLLTSSAILPHGNYNHSLLDDPYINAKFAELAAVPATALNLVAHDWETLDEYVANNADVAVIGYRAVPALTSRRISQNYVFSPVYGWDWSSLRLK